MRLVKFLLALAVTTGLIYLLNTHQPFGAPFPALGKVLNPYSGFWRNAESTAERDDRQIDFSNLRDSVSIVFDERMVPHIFARNLEDAFFAQGYAHAMHRLWAMDISVRKTEGRLSEVLGAATLPIDRAQRRKGMRHAAENTLEVWKTREREWRRLEAYTAGVNAYVASLAPKDYPLEFKLLDYQPEPWTPLKSAIFFKSMAETLCSGNDDLASTNALEAFGAEVFDFLYPEYNPAQSPVIPSTVDWNFDTLLQVRDTLTQLTDFHPTTTYPDLTPLREGVGSNNWALAGSRTAEGNPILGNDPHLDLTLPSIWYEIQIHTPELNAYGVSLPGVPGVIIGFNEHIAWGVTNVSHDVLDWYTVDWIDAKKTRYRYDGGIREAELVLDTIAIRGDRPRIDTLRFTHWGPVVHESKTRAKPDLAMHWIAHDIVDKEKAFFSLSVFTRLMGARNYEGYAEALLGYENPAQNFVFASREGDIALKANGRYPLRYPQQGRFIMDGEKAENAWQDFIPLDQIPQVLNPERGFVASANQRTTDTTYPYYYLGNFDDYRGRLINRRLDSLRNATIEDMMKLQNENYSLLAEDALPVLLGLLDSVDLSPRERQAVDLLRDWDVRFEKDARAPVLFEEWMHEAYRETFDEILILNDSVDMLFPENWRFVQLMKQDPAHRFFDRGETPEEEDAPRILQRALQQTLQRLDTVLRKPSYDWAAHKGTLIGHLGRISAFSSDTLDVGGYDEAPNSIKPDNGPSWRMIVELDKPVKAYGVYPGGQSGNPGSPFYDNMIDTWVRGEYFRLFFMEDREDRRQPRLYELSMAKGPAAQSPAPETAAPRDTVAPQDTVQ